MKYWLYRFDGEEYASLSELLKGPIRRAHPGATHCFIEGGCLWIEQPGVEYVTYGASRQGRLFTIGPRIDQG